MKLDNDGNVAIVAIIAVALAIVVILLIISTSTASDTWDTDWFDDDTAIGSDEVIGAWKQRIDILFVDGTTESLKMMHESEGGLFSVQYNEKDVDYITYYLYIYATSEESTSAGLSSFNIIMELSSDGTIIESKSMTVDSRTVSLDEDILLMEFLVNIDNIIEDYSYDIYNLTFKTDVTNDVIQVKGIPDGETQQIPIPSSRYIILKVPADDGNGGDGDGDGNGDDDDDYDGDPEIHIELGTDYTPE